MSRISINNGNSFCSVREAVNNMEWGVILNMMDRGVMSQVHDEIAPCTNEDFLARYLELAGEDLIIG